MTTSASYSIGDLHANLLRRLNIGDTLNRTALRMPNKIAYVSGERRITFALLNDWVNRVFLNLSGWGCKQGSTVLLHVTNSIEFMVVFYACAKSGAICVPLNQGWKAKEIAHVISDAKVTFAVVDGGESLANLRSAIGALAQEGHPAPGKIKALFNVGVDRDAASYFAADIRLVEKEFHKGYSTQRSPISKTTPFDSLSLEVCQQSLPKSSSNIDTTKPKDEVGGWVAYDVLIPDDAPLTYLYTSGTTSEPKGIVLTHKSIYMSNMTAAIDLGFRSTDVLLGFMPFFHSAQLLVFNTPAVAMGMTTVIEPKFSIEKVIELVPEEKVTVLFALPSMYIELCRSPLARNRKWASSVRLCVYAMGPLPPVHAKEVTDYFGCPFCLFFGMSELGPITSILKPDIQHPNSIGLPALNVEVRIVDANDNPLPAGQIGEIVYRSPQTMEGYLDKHINNAEVLRNGWLHSGDGGYFDDDGVLWFQDRIKDVIKTGGENVSSSEVEKHILDLFKEVEDVAVVGLPHHHWIEAVTAIVVLRQSDYKIKADPKAAEGVRTALGSRMLSRLKETLSSFKVPKSFIFVDSIPKTATGKPRKHILRQRFADYYSSRAETSNQQSRL